MRCTLCRKEKHEFHSIPYRIRLYILGFFQDDLQDAKDDSFTKGFGEGYEAGFKKVKEIINKTQYHA